MKIGKSVNGSNNGISIDNDNYWYSNGLFKIGGASKYLSWDNTNLTVKGTIHATDGTITG